MVTAITVLPGCGSGSTTAPVTEETSYKMMWSWDMSEHLWSIAVSPDGSLVVWKDDSNVYAWSREGKNLWNYMKSGTESVCISADGAYVAAGACLLNREGKLLWQKIQPISSISLSADGSYLAAGWGGSTSSIATSETVGRQVYFYNKDGKLLWTRETGWSLEDGGVRSVSISSDGAYVAAGTGDNNVYLFDREGKPLWSYQTGKAIYDVSLSADGAYVAAGSEDYSIYFFNREGALLWSYKTSYCVGKVLVSSDGSYVAAMATDGYVYLLDREGNLLWKGAEVRLGLVSGGIADSISISSDASYVAVGGRDSKVYLYNRKGELIFHYGPEDESEGYISKSRIDTISISSDGSTIAAGTEDGRVYFFEKPK